MNKENVAELYRDGIIPDTSVINAVLQKLITTDDAVEIIGSEKVLDTVKAIKLKEISAICHNTIIAGIDLKIGDRIDHFNLDVVDQNNINNLFKIVELGGTEYPYQADYGVCSVYSAADIANIYIMAQKHITYHTSYHNALKQYIQSLDDIEAIKSVSYGDELPEPYANALAEKMEVAQTQMEGIMAKLGG